MNTVQNLTGTWYLMPDPKNQGRQELWFDNIGKGVKVAPVPGIIQQVFPDYHGVAWYWHEFIPPHRLDSRERYLLRFWAVDYMAEVWINGKPVGGHEGAETPFTLNITDAVKPGANNLLAVRVLNPTREPIEGISLKEIPHLNKTIPWFMGGKVNIHHGGIVDSVELYMAPAVRVVDLFCRPDPKTGVIRIQTTVFNILKGSVKADLSFTVAPATSGEKLDFTSRACDLPAGETVIDAELRVEDPHLWELNNPWLYRVTGRLATKDGDSDDEYSVRCGFRDFRFEKGYFRLNGRRIFLRGAHTVNVCPVGFIHVPLEPGLLRRDLLYAKVMGLNTIRFIAGMAKRYQLDLCDEIGLMVYEESYASWNLGNSPRMAEYYDRSTKEMILRDRNHPCITIWGMLNETSDGPVFRHAVKTLELVRTLDDSRLTILNSGRFDHQLDIGSFSNPGSKGWEYVVGAEAPGTPPAELMTGSSGDPYKGAGDYHMYPRVPHSAETIEFLRTLGHDTKHVFLSEYGIGSALDMMRLVALYEQYGHSKAEDAQFHRANRDRFLREWKRWKMEEAFGRPEDYFHQALSRMAPQRLLALNAIRANPNIVGYSITSLVDVLGEGLVTAFRELKSGTIEAIADGFAPLRWCLFVEPLNIYRGGTVRLEAVLANEDVLLPGEYEVLSQVFGPNAEKIFERRIKLTIPERGKVEAPLSIPVLSEDAVIDGPAGRYRFVASFEHGAAPAGGEVTFYVADPKAFPTVDAEVVLWSEDAELAQWLTAQGIRCRGFAGQPTGREIILVSRRPAPPANAAAFVELACHMARGSTVVFLAPEVFRRGEDRYGWLPVKDKESFCEVASDLYNKDEWAKHHPIFDGLPAGGLIDEVFYRELIPDVGWNGTDVPEEAVAGANRCSMHPSSGYSSGLLISVHRLKAGRFILNTFRILENLGRHPAADRLLLNLIQYASRDMDQPLTNLPVNFDRQVYTEIYPPVSVSMFKKQWKVSNVLPDELPMRKVVLPDAATLSWRPVVINSRKFADINFMDFHALDGETGGLVYARGEIEVPVAMTADILLGTDGPCKVWLDDDEVGLVKQAENPAIKDAYAFPITLTSGRRMITVAFNRRGGKAWGFFLRVKRTDVATFTPREIHRGAVVLPVMDL